MTLKKKICLSLFYVSLVPHDLSSCHFSLLVPLPPSPQPNGRFELNQKICLSASAYHPEMWQASWGSKKHYSSSNVPFTSSFPSPPDFYSMYICTCTCTLCSTGKFGM